MVVYAPAQNDRYSKQKNNETHSDFMMEIHGMIVQHNQTLVWMGDFNASMGRGKLNDEAVGLHGYGKCNERGAALRTNTGIHGLISAGTRRVDGDGANWTHHMENTETYRCIDYIFVPDKLESRLLRAGTWDCDVCMTDHRAVICTLKRRRKKRCQRRSKMQVDWSALEDPNTRARYQHLCAEKMQQAIHHDAQDVTARYDRVRGVVLEAAAETLPAMTSGPSTRFITLEIRQLIDERKHFLKQGKLNKQERRRMNFITREVKRKIRETKEIVVQKMCKATNTAAMRGDLRTLYTTVRQITGKQVPRQNTQIPLWRWTRHFKGLVSSMKRTVNDKEKGRAAQLYSDELRAKVKGLMNMNGPTLAWK